MLPAAPVGMDGFVMGFPSFIEVAPGSPRACTDIIIPGKLVGYFLDMGREPRRSRHEGGVKGIINPVPADVQCECRMPCCVLLGVRQDVVDQRCVTIKQAESPRL